MCGIAGFVGSGGRNDLRRMIERIQYRGPDAVGYWADESKQVYLGHARLSIVDLVHGAQPMWTADGLLGVVFNGEIYNQLELRQELEANGHVFRTDHSDTEVLLHGYREWGEDLPRRLNGMWAFAIYDVAGDSILLSRDPFGQKPLFYALQRETFVFASELSAVVLHPAISANVSVRSLQKYFAYGFIPAPNALYENTFKLPAGHNLRVRRSDLECQVSRYWDFVIEPFETAPRNAEHEYAEQLRHLIDKAVKRILVADVPIGVFLSGGIDSSCIANAAKRHKPDIQSFSIGFQEETFDESPYAESMSKHLGLRHHLDHLSYEGCRTLLPTISRTLDEPIADGSLVPTYLLCQTARKHVTVAIGGDGADELFAGYDPFRALRLASTYSKLMPRPVHQAIQMLVGRLPAFFSNMSLEFRLKRTLRGLSYPRRLWNPVWHGCLEPRKIEELLCMPVDIENLYEEAIRYWESCRSENLFDKTLTFYTKMYLQDNILVKVDRASMMNSLEVRSPFLDAELVDFVRRVPHYMKYRDGQTKWLLRQAMAAEGIPTEILQRKKKGFGMPIAKWLQSGQFTVPIRHPGIRMNNALRHRYWREHRKGDSDHRIFLWGHYMFAAGGYGELPANVPPAVATTAPVAPLVTIPTFAQPSARGLVDA